MNNIEVENIEIESLLIAIDRRTAFVNRNGEMEKFGLNQ